MRYKWSESSNGFTILGQRPFASFLSHCFNKKNQDGTETAELRNGEEGETNKERMPQMKSIAYLTLVGGLALVCAGPVVAGPIGDSAGDGGSSDFFTSPPPPPLGQDVLDFINSLGPDGGDQAVILVYDTSQYMPPSGANLNDVQISWTDIAGLTTGAYDQYWLTHTSPPPQPLFAPLFFNAPTGNLGESDTAGEGYMFSVTFRRIVFLAPVPEPAPLALIAIGLVALSLMRRRMKRA